MTHSRQVVKVEGNSSRVNYKKCIQVLDLHNQSIALFWESCISKIQNSIKNNFVESK